MKSRFAIRCALVGVLILVLFVPGCKKPKANTQNSSQGGSSNFSAPDPGGAVQNVRGAVLRVGVENDLKQFALFYMMNNKPPASLMDLPDVKRDLPKLYKEIMDGDVIVYWNADPTRAPEGTSNTVLAYVAKATSQGRLVVFLDGHVRNMSEPEFAKAAKAGK